AYGDYISQKAYAIAQVADKIYCNPKGIFQWQGLSVEYVFFKNLIDKLEIKPQIFYAGKFKSATEPFRATEMSEPNKEQTSVWLEDIYGEMIAQVSKSRKLHLDTLRNYANRYAIDVPEKAVQLGLIDGVKYDDEVKDEIRKRLGISKTDKIGFVSISKYKDAVSLVGPYAKDKIALVVAEGEIVYGKGTPDQIGSDEYLSLLRKLRNDKSVKAIVMRINSPGGSSLASEIIWRELELIKKQKIPIIVSMGDVAASGGYYIAANANKIYVQPNTITGSIGVFSIIPDFSSFMKNKLGVTFDRVKTSEFADAPSVTRSLSEREKQIVQHEIDRIYTDFKTRVSDGRKKDMQYVDSIAQGRVGTGKRAIQLGLADAIGGEQDAIIEAAKLAGIKEYKVRRYPEEKTFLEYILQQYPNELSSSSIEKEMGRDEYMIFKRIRSLKEESGEIKSRLPFDFFIR
ncbi:MAG: signal peptide peptidase SppA, partial [bacterium]